MPHNQKMTRFIYIADTHLGAAAMGYQQQTGYPEKLPEILAALNAYLRDMGNVAFVLHGGDMVDAASDDNIRAAAGLFAMPVPVYLCLGNHDLTVPTARQRWLELAPEFFLNGRPECMIETEHCVVHVVPNHWHELPYYWADVQDVHFSPDQVDRLARDLDAMPHLPHMVLTHCAARGVPVEQTGLSEPFHAPNASFAATIAGLAAQHPCLQCVLGAHNHMNMHVRSDEVEYLTVSALVETPFELKLFEVTADSITMSTASLDASLSFNGEYDVARSFVQGRPIDRSFATACHASRR